MVKRIKEITLKTKFLPQMHKKEEIKYTIANHSFSVRWGSKLQSLVNVMEYYP